MVDVLAVFAVLQDVGVLRLAVLNIDDRFDEPVILFYSLEVVIYRFLVLVEVLCLLHHLVSLVGLRDLLSPVQSPIGAVTSLLRSKCFSASIKHLDCLLRISQLLVADINLSIFDRSLLDGLESVNFPYTFDTSAMVRTL